jgi:prepilin-type N-terminal cleavage/methylation domain-containing protein
MKNIKNKAFTLIELLVVVAIISLLSSVVIASLQGSREKAAVTKLKEQVRQIQTALELYRSDRGAYPVGEPSNTYSLTIPDLMSELEPYIESTVLDTTQIKSYTIDSSNIIYYPTFEGSSLEDYSCEGSPNAPYFIYTYISEEASFETFPQLTYGDTIFEYEYCLNTPI